MIGIYSNNQVPELKVYNLYVSDPPLRRAVERGGASWCEAELQRQGAEYGSVEVLQAAKDANRFTPELQQYSAIGERIDAVCFHPAWHRFMSMARRNGIGNLFIFHLKGDHP